MGVDEVHGGLSGGLEVGAVILYKVLVEFQGLVV